MVDGTEIKTQIQIQLQIQIQPQTKAQTQTQVQIQIKVQQNDVEKTFHASATLVKGGWLMARSAAKSAQMKSWTRDEKLEAG